MHRTSAIRWATGLMLSILAAGPAVPQEAPHPGHQRDPAPLIRVSSNLILVPVSVTDASGRPITGLGISDFRVEEDGVPQSVVSIGDPEATPLEMGLLLDISGSLKGQFGFQVGAATRFLEQVLRQEDSVLLVSIGEEPRVVIDHTRDAVEAAQMLRTLEPTKSSTAFFDTVATAAARLRDRPRRNARRVMVVLSDGEDNNSQQYQLGRVHEALQHADCVFYSINPSRASIRLNMMSRRGQEGMEELAAGTGGSAYLSDSPEELVEIFRRIRSELTSQYLLGYYSSNPSEDGSFHRISVTLPTQTDLRVRARRGYFAARDTSAQ